MAQDGSNINPVALKWLNLKLPNGTYVVPTPQQIVNGEGEYAFSTPCTYNENQFMTNVDYLQSEKSKFSAKFFFSDANALQSLLQSNVPGSPDSTTPAHRNLSVTHDYIFSPSVVNQVQFGFHRTATTTGNPSAFNFPEIGSTVIPQSKDWAQFIFGEETVGAIENGFFSSNAYTLQDTLTYVHGRHNFRFGGGVTRTASTFNLAVSSFLEFLSFQDLLLGQSAAREKWQCVYSNNIYFSYDEFRDYWAETILFGTPGPMHRTISK